MSVEITSPSLRKPLALYEAHRGELIAYASRIVGDRASGEDVVQEAWLRFDAAARLRWLDEPLGYLYRVVRNLAHDGRRRRLSERRVVTDHDIEVVAEIVPDAAPAPDVTALFTNECDLLLKALAELPERTRVALEMHRLGGAKLREIAAVLGVSLPMAHVLVADGVRHCKKRLGWP